MGLVSKMGLTVAAHPMEYASTLIRIGHEPLEPIQTRTLLGGKPALGLPNVFKYVGVIRKRSGFIGLYAGLTPRLLAVGVTEVVTDKFDEFWPKEEEEKKEPQVTDEMRLLLEMRRNAALRVTVTFFTQPLHVLSVRIMAQFVGKEDKYNHPIAAIKEILEQNGLAGFWAGFIPRAVGEVLLTVLGSSLVYALNKYVLTEEGLKQHTEHVAGFVASSLVYPFTVVSQCMMVSRSGLAAGLPPNMPLYTSWGDCFHRLSMQKGQLKRGSSLFFR